MDQALLSRKCKGDLAELKVATDLVARGYGIAFPYGEENDFDLVLCRGERLERVQVKYAHSDGEILLVRCSSHSLTNGKVRATKRYTAQMIDWLAVYDAATDACFYIAAEDLGAGMSVLTLRLCAAKNRQRAGIRMADDYRAI